MVEPIQSIFASGTNNKLQLTESQISSGIKYQGAVVSNELNAQFNRTDLAIDELQRTVGFYNNKRKYSKWDLAKILVNYNGVYGIVTLAWNNVESSNQPPFVEVDSTPALEFTYNYNNATPMLIISTESKDYFELKNFLNSNFWDIVGMSENLKQLETKGERFVVAFNNDKKAVGNNITLTLPKPYYEYYCVTDTPHDLGEWNGEQISIIGGASVIPLSLNLYPRLFKTIKIIYNLNFFTRMVFNETKVTFYTSPYNLGGAVYYQYSYVSFVEKVT